MIWVSLRCLLFAHVHIHTIVAAPGSTTRMASTSQGGFSNTSNYEGLLKKVCYTRQRAFDGSFSKYICRVSELLQIMEQNIK